MKTIQEWLKELDTDRLIGAYLFNDPIQYDCNRSWLDRTVREIRDAWTDRIRQYIDRLRTIPIKEPEDGHRGLVYVHRIIRNGMHDQSAGLVHVDELLAQGCEAPDYGCELTDQAEIVGFLVADTPLTQRYMYELMADVLNSASFFGFEQETLEAERQKLDEAMEEIESGTAKMIPWETIKADLEKSIDCRFDEESEDERVLHNQVMEAENAYSRHSRQKELNAIRAMLMAEGEL